MGTAKEAIILAAKEAILLAAKEAIIMAAREAIVLAAKEAMAREAMAKACQMSIRHRWGEVVSADTVESACTETTTVIT